MSEQSTALRLADALRNIAADTSLSDRYCEVMSEADDELRRLSALNGELLEALKLLVSYTMACEGLLNASPAGQINIARSAIAKAEGKV